jgi:asparagine synthase (glutamine-hydrolysing)
MSGLVGVFSAREELPEKGIAREALRRSGRGNDRIGIWRDQVALLGVGRGTWETAGAFSGPVDVVEADDLVVAVDASVYYRRQLQDALAAAGIRTQRATPSHLAAAAFRAWGAVGVNRVEGDFAYLVWNRVTRTAMCVRDFVGTRPLYYAETNGTLVVASSIASILAFPEQSQALNLTAIAEAAAGLFASSHETCYQGISMLPAGSTLVWRNGVARVRGYWAPPPVEESDPRPFGEAAHELRSLLSAAVTERMDDRMPTSIWLSGGWDSPSVFAVGSNALEQHQSSLRLEPVSISYPPGDPGREDELISAIANHWRTQVRWIDIRDIPLFHDPIERAKVRQEPFAHVFEMWNRALAGGSAAQGARVALTGVGGDHLFQVSPIYLADLLRGRQWRALYDEWKVRGRGRTGLRTLKHWAGHPLLARSSSALTRRGRGGPGTSSYLDRRVPEWIDAEFARRHHLADRERRHSPPRVYAGHAAHETYWMLCHPYGARVMSSVFSFGLENHLEIRSPFLDERIIRFALSRPVAERASLRETKRLLRQAMRGLLPDHVLEPRAVRTGVTSGYLDHSLRVAHAQLLTNTFRNPVLAELGIVNPVILQRCCAEYLSGRARRLGVGLFLTLQTELWTRFRVASPTQ